MARQQSRAFAIPAPLYSQGEVLVALLVFSGGQGRNRRPVLEVRDFGDADLLVVPVTSHRAHIERIKLSGYSLSPTHPERKHKARVFAASLGIGLKQAGWLEDQLFKVARESALLVNESPFYFCGDGAESAVLLDRCRWWAHD